MARRYGIGTGLPDIAPHQDPNQFALFNPLYQAITGLAKSVSDAIGLTVIDKEELQKVGPFIEYAGNNSKRINLEAAQQILPGRLVFLDGTAGESRMWHADATSGINRVAMGLCIESAAVEVGERGRIVLFSGLLTNVSGVTPGTIYWLGANGQFSPSMPVTAGWTQQKVGIGINSSSIVINISL